jgi:hypothetical protein
MVSESYERFGYDKVTNEPFVYDVAHKKRAYGEQAMSELGYKKKMTLRILSTKTPFYKPIPNSTLVEKVECWVLRTYEVTVKDCNVCEQAKKQIPNFKGYDFLSRQSVKTCVFQTCMITLRTNLISDTDDKERFRLISEKPIETLAQILELYKKGEIDFIADSGLWSVLEQHLQVKL